MVAYLILELFFLTKPLLVYLLGSRVFILPGRDSLSSLHMVVELRTQAPWSYILLTLWMEIKPPRDRPGRDKESTVPVPCSNVLIKTKRG